MNQDNPAHEQISRILTDLFSENKVWKLVFSKSRQKNSLVKSMVVTPFYLRDEKVCKCVFRQDTKELTANETLELFLSSLEHRLSSDFYNLDIITEDITYLCLQNKQGKISILKKKKPHIFKDAFSHDHQKISYVNQEAPYYKKLGLISGNDKVFSKGQKKYNQVNKYLETIHHLMEGKSTDHPFRIVDMGSGKAYLTFAIYDYFKIHKNWDVRVTGYEARPDLVDACNAIARDGNMEHLFFEAKSIDEAPVQSTDMVIALHACDIATDMAIAYGVKNNADFIILAPCCQKQVRKSMEIPESLQPLMKHGILLERQAEILTDGLRALMLEYHGYSTKVFEFISLEHTGKNVMIIAEKSKKNPAAKEAFLMLKNTFGLGFHYLEKILPFS